MIKKPTPEELKAICESHAKWLRGEAGVRANLQGANLRSADLYGANLYGADLQGADLRSADLQGAYLYGADLRSAYLYGANLYGANLRSADLYGANLRSANLYGANLRSANLYGANLRSANLYGADLQGANLPHFELPDGDLLVWKKARGSIVQLRIPREAKRTASLVGRKCRAEYAVVEAIFDSSGKAVEQAESSYQAGFFYRVGETVRSDRYNDDVRVECAPGIHFFATRREAEEY